MENRTFVCAENDSLRTNRVSRYVTLMAVDNGLSLDYVGAGAHGGKRTVLLSGEVLRCDEPPPPARLGIEVWEEADEIAPSETGKRRQSAKKSLGDKASGRFNRIFLYYFLRHIQPYSTDAYVFLCHPTRKLTFPQVRLSCASQ